MYDQLILRSSDYTDVLFTHSVGWLADNVDCFSSVCDKS